MSMRAKRIFDVSLATIALIGLSPVLAIIALAVKLDSRGPVLFRQVRVGRGGRNFTILKFRTMVEGVTEAPNVSPRGDPRTTRVGRFLRDWFLDELPQLVNVIRGDMSVVGPRPETPEYVALYTEAERRVLSVRPGITGPSAIEYSAIEADLLAAQDDPARYYVGSFLHDRARADLDYVDSVSMIGDLKMLVMTIGLLFRTPRLKGDLDGRQPNR